MPTSIQTATKAAIKMEKERRKTLNQQEAWALAKMVVASPMAQMVGTVAIAETLEAAGILSGRWAGAIEGGVITMVGLQALKDYGVIGATMVGAGIGVGALTEGTWEGVKNLLLGGAIMGEQAPLTRVWDWTLGKYV